MSTPMVRLVRALCSGLVLSFAPSSPAAVTLHVALNGNDAWSGKLPRPNADGSDGPLATLAGARDAVRRLKTAGSGRGEGGRRRLFAQGDVGLRAARQRHGGCSDRL